MKKALKRIGLGICALLVLAVAACAVAEHRTREEAAAKFPPPGKLVDIGGRRIQIDCRGEGSPTVVLEAGADLSGGLGWSHIQGELAPLTRTCSYSRAGLMWSDPASGSRNGETVADDLRAALKAAGEQPPFVLVGESLGGAYAVTATTRWGSDVAGLVLVDASYPDQEKIQSAITQHPPPSVPMTWKIAGALSGLGAPRLIVGTPRDDALSALQTPQMRAVQVYAPMSFAAFVKELEGIGKTLDDVKAAHDLGARPLYVLTAMQPLTDAGLKETQMTRVQANQVQAAWKTKHDDMARWSSNSQHLLLGDSGHDISAEKPGAVIHAVSAVVDAVRSGEAMKP